MRYLLIISFLLAACGGERKVLERGAIYEREGMLAEAYALYAERYARSDRSVEAHIGMKRTAQGISDRLQAEAGALYLLHDLAAGDRVREQVTEYHQRQLHHRIELQWSPTVETDRQQAVTYIADQALDESMEALRLERYDEALRAAERCLALDPDRKEAAYVQRIAMIEPWYQQGRKAMDLGLLRDAHRFFAKVTDRDPTYKDAWTLQRECREEATVALAYVPLYNGQLYANELSGMLGGSTVEAQLAANMKQAILGLNDPLIVLVDRDNTEELLAQQRRQMSGVYDDRYSAEAGRLIGARYVLTGKVLRFDDVLTRQIELQVQIIDAFTGQVHLSEIVRVHKAELERGSTRAQLLERSATRAAGRVAAFDPHGR